MKLYTSIEYDSAKTRDYLKFYCDYCNIHFEREKWKTNEYRNNILDGNEYCSLQCKGFDSKIVRTQCVCTNCQKSYLSRTKDLRNHNRKSSNTFCSKSCAASYNNKHKKHGTRRSKLECWLEVKLVKLYPNLIFNFNKKDAIDSELDIYIPSFKLAFELNGIFHYEAIYGDDKLSKVQRNDSNKFKLCHKNDIELCIIDVSNQSYFKESTSQKYLDIITNIINQKM